MSSSRSARNSAKGRKKDGPERRIPPRSERGQGRSIESQEMPELLPKCTKFMSKGNYVLEFYSRTCRSRGQARLGWYRDSALAGPVARSLARRCLSTPMSAGKSIPFPDLLGMSTSSHSHPG